MGMVYVQRGRRVKNTRPIRTKKPTATYGDIIEAEKRERFKFWETEIDIECKHTNKPPSPVVMIADRKMQLFFDSWGKLIGYDNAY